MRGSAHAWYQPDPGRGATRAGLLEATSYTIDLDLTTGDKTFASTTTIRFTCNEPGAETFADLVGAIIHEITLNGEPARRGLELPGQPDPPDRPAGGERAGGPRRLCLLALRRGPAPLRRPGRRPGVPLHPVRGAGRPPRLHDVRAARPQGHLHFTVTAPADWTVVVQRAHARARADRRGQGPVWQLPADRSGCRPTSRRWSRASTTERPTPTTASTATIPLGHYCRQSLVEHLDADELFTDHQAGLRVLRGGLRLPVPVRKYDQLFVPEYNMGAMENAGA